MHGGGDLAVSRPERARRGGRRPDEADTPGEPPELERRRRQRVGLELVEDLQPMLHGPQVHVRLREHPAEVGDQVPALGQSEGRLQRVALTQPRVLAAVEELERLDEELDLTDPAAPELDVGRRAARLDERPVDLPLHRADRRDDPSVEARPVDGLARQLHEARPHAEVAGRDARLDERLALPELGAVPVIVAVPVERQDDGAHPPLGPEAQVDAERVALVRDLLEERHDPPADAREVLAVGDAAVAAARRLAVGPVGEHEVDVGRVVELLAAELPHRDDRHAGLRPGRVARRAVRDARRGLGERERFGEARVGEVRQLRGRHGEVGVTQKVSRADAQQVAVLHAAQPSHPRLARLEGGEGLGELCREVLRQPDPHRARLEEPGECLRPAAERVGEELARAEDAHEQGQRAGVLGERRVEDGPVDHGRMALQVVERHVGIGRGLEGGEEPRDGRRQQLRVPRGRREAVEIRQRGGRIGESEPAEVPLGGVQTADSPVSPVRMRIDSLIGSTNTFPSPMEPVFAAPTMVATTLSTRLSATTTSIFTFGRKSTVYSEPR